MAHCGAKVIQVKWKKVVKALSYIMQTAVTIIRNPETNQCVIAQHNERVRETEKEWEVHIHKLSVEYEILMSCTWTRCKLIKFN